MPKPSVTTTGGPGVPSPRVLWQLLTPNLLGVWGEHHCPPQVWHCETLSTSLCHQTSQWLCSPGHMGLQLRVEISQPHPFPLGMLQNLVLAPVLGFHRAGFTWLSSALQLLILHLVPWPQRAGLGQPPPQERVFLEEGSIPVCDSSPYCGWGGLGSPAVPYLGTPLEPSPAKPLCVPHM